MRLTGATLLLWIGISYRRDTSTMMEVLLLTKSNIVALKLAVCSAGLPSFISRLFPSIIT